MVPYSPQSPRTQRVDVLFYSTVRGGRIKGSLSASSRNLHKAFSLEEVEAFALAAFHRQSKTHFLYDLCVFAVSIKYVSVFMKICT